MIASLFSIAFLLYDLPTSPSHCTSPSHFTSPFPSHLISPSPSHCTSPFPSHLISPSQVLLVETYRSPEVDRPWLHTHSLSFSLRNRLLHPLSFHHHLCVPCEPPNRSSSFSSAFAQTFRTCDLSPFSSRPTSRPSSPRSASLAAVERGSGALKGDPVTTPAGEVAGTAGGKGGLVLKGSADGKAGGNSTNSGSSRMTSTKLKGSNPPYLDLMAEEGGRSESGKAAGVQRNTSVSGRGAPAEDSAVGREASFRRWADGEEGGPAKSAREGEGRVSGGSAGGKGEGGLRPLRLATPSHLAVQMSGPAMELMRQMEASTNIGVVHLALPCDEQGFIMT